MVNTKISNKRLKAIVFTDIVNFTKLSAQDEQHALELIDKQRDTLKPIVKKHNGKWLKEIGDGLLFSFDSSLDAVNCAIKIQQSLKDVNDFKIRIGIHQGDIFIKDGDVYGDDVNIASRVEGFAPAGGIAISDKINKDISGVKNIKTTFIGHRKLRGVEQETQIRCIVSDSLPHYEINLFPKITYYMSFFIGILFSLHFVMFTFLFVGTDLLGWDGYSINDVYTTTAGHRAFMYLSTGIIFILFGYSAVSYSKGLSHNAQKFILYFTYIYTFFHIIIESITIFNSLSFSKDALILNCILVAIAITITIPVIRIIANKK